MTRFGDGFRAPGRTITRTCTRTHDYLCVQAYGNRERPTVFLSEYAIHTEENLPYVPEAHALLALKPISCAPHCCHIAPLRTSLSGGSF